MNWHHICCKCWNKNKKTGTEPERIFDALKHENQSIGCYSLKLRESNTLFDLLCIKLFANI